MQQQEDGHNKNPFRSLLDRLMRNEGGYSTIEIGQLKYALDGFYGAARAPADSAAPGEQLTREQIREVFMAHGFTIKEGQTDLKQYVYDAAHALLELGAVPRQEAQEPVAWLNPWRADQVTTDYDAYGERGIPLYTAPQPAPAPLSEMSYKKRKAIQEDEQIGASDAWFKARHNMLDTLDRRNVFRAGFDRGWNAAIAAQGGKV
jgi:hypothetical protein